MAIKVKKQAATEDFMSGLHEMTASLMQRRLEQAMRDEITIPPAELGAIIKFLKDNGIECVRDDLENKFGKILDLKVPEFKEVEEAFG